MVFKRIGLIVPSSNTVMEEELWRNMPLNFTICTTRLKLEDVTEKALLKMTEGISRCSQLLKDCEVDIIVFGCTSGSFVGGKDHSKVIQKKIEEVSGTKAITTSQAVLECLRFKKIRRLSVITPYVEEVNLKEREFLKSHGFEVLNIHGFGIIENTEIGRLSPGFVAKEALKYSNPEADGIFLSCTNLKTFEILEILESKVKKPVVSSNSATLWCLRELEV
ncbi:MAG: maleate cis-trans isomerase [Candidatus Methanofastidiosia archaeon]